MEEEKSGQVELQFSDLVAVLRHCWWIMAIVFVVAAVSLFAFMKATHEPEYTAEASIYVMRSSQDPDSNVGNTTSTSDVSIATYLAKDCPELVKSHRVLERVIYERNLIMDYETLAKRVKVENLENTRMVYLSVRASTPEEAAAVVTTLAEVTCDFMNNEMYDGQKLFRPVDTNVVPQQISNPISLVLILLVAFVLAFAIYAIYLIRFLMDDKINSPEDVEKYLGLNVLGQIPNRDDTSRRKKYYGYGQTAEQ